jgi:hypothetical protein
MLTLISPQLNYFSFRLEFPNEWMPAASHVYRNDSRRMTQIPEESYVVITGILVGDGIVVRLLAESGSICHYMFYKHANPPGLVGSFFSGVLET